MSLTTVKICIDIFPQQAVEEDGFYRIRVSTRSGGVPVYVSSFVKAVSVLLMATVGAIFMV